VRLSTAVVRAGGAPSPEARAAACRCPVVPRPGADRDPCHETPQVSRPGAGRADTDGLCLVDWVDRTDPACLSPSWNAAGVVGPLSEAPPRRPRASHGRPLTPLLSTALGRPL